MADRKRYFWLKLQEDFFDAKAVKKLRKMAGGDTYTIIYLKMQLRSIRENGVLEWEGLEDTFADELALDLDESPEDVKMTVLYLVNSGLAIMDDDRHMIMPYVCENLGTEGASAQRVREYRERKALQCNTDVTPVKRLCNTDIDIEKSREDTDKEKSTAKTPKHFTPPTLDEVKAYCEERGNGIDAEYFLDYYTARKWMSGKTKITDWKSCVRTWERKKREWGKDERKKASGGNWDLTFDV